MISMTIARFPWTLGGGISSLAWTYTRVTANNSKLLWQALAPWQSQRISPREGMPCNMQLWSFLGGGQQYDLSKIHFLPMHTCQCWNTMSCGHVFFLHYPCSLSMITLWRKKACMQLLREAMVVIPNGCQRLALV